MNPQLVISHATDGITIEDAILTHQDAQEGFIYSLQEISCKSNHFDKFIDEVNNIEKLTEFDYSLSKNKVYKKYKSENIRLYVSGNSLDLYVATVTKTEEMSNEIWKAYIKHSDSSDTVPIYMHSFFLNNGVLDMASKVFKTSEFDTLSEAYYPYIDTNIMFDQFFTGAENILLLVGAPGLGKSKLSTLALKHAYKNPGNLPYDKLSDNPNLDNQYISAAYVKSTDVLANDKFWRELERYQPDFCIIDDLDYMLTKRDADIMTSDDTKKNSFLNQFLSFTDGVEKHKTKFIITTNQSYDDIDTALLRKGRLFDILELRELHNDEAKSIWFESKLNEDDFNKIFGDKSVSSADLGSEINKRLNKRIKTSTKSYLKEPNISKVNKAGREKRISL